RDGRDDGVEKESHGARVARSVLRDAAGTTQTNVGAREGKTAERVDRDRERQQRDVLERGIEQRSRAESLLSNEVYRIRRGEQQRDRLKDRGQDSDREGCPRGR